MCARFNSGPLFEFFVSVCVNICLQQLSAMHFYIARYSQYWWLVLNQAEAINELSHLLCPWVLHVHVDVQVTHHDLVSCHLYVCDLMLGIDLLLYMAVIYGQHFKEVGEFLDVRRRTWQQSNFIDCNDGKQTSRCWTETQTYLKGGEGHSALLINLHIPEIEGCKLRWLIIVGNKKIAGDTSLVAEENSACLMAWQNIK